MSVCRSANFSAGASLMMALVVLVIMSVAAISLVRSVNTGKMIASNLAFRQAAALASDAALKRPYAGWSRRRQQRPCIRISLIRVITPLFLKASISVVWRHKVCKWPSTGRAMDVQVARPAIA